MEEINLSLTIIISIASSVVGAFIYAIEKLKSESEKGSGRRNNFK